MTDPSEPRLAIADIELDFLAQALSDGSFDRTWYFSTTSGDVRPSGDWDEGYDEDELAAQGWVHVNPSGSRVGFADMEDFAKSIGDLRARDVLQRSLEGKGAFRRFRDALRELGEVRQLWHNWSDAQQQARAVRWLLDEGHVDELEADAALNDLRATAAATMETVRLLGGVSYDVDDAAASWGDIVSRLGRGDQVTLTRDGRPFASISPFA